MNRADSNRINAKNSTGPSDTTLTRFNAVKHGLSAKGITEPDDSDAYDFSATAYTGLRSRRGPGNLLGTKNCFLHDQIGPSRKARSELH